MGGDLVTGPALDLTGLPGLSPRHQDLLEDVASRNDDVHGSDLVGLVLSGSAGRGLATERSDLDVYVVLGDDGVPGPAGQRPGVDEVPVTLSNLEHVPPFGSDGWWFRWSFAWAPVLLDRTGGRLQPALLGQATVSAAEAQEILVEHGRLDGWLNYAYRALKSARDGRALEARLDAAESMPWLLDVVFALSGRVRPYHSYLPWELREHPLNDWRTGELLPLLAGTLEGDASAIRSTFERVESLCAAFDGRRQSRVLASIIEDWGDALHLMRP